MRTSARRRSRHARAVVSEFQDAFPTPGEVSSQAANLRDRFASKMPVSPECQASGFISRGKAKTTLRRAFAAWAQHNQLIRRSNFREQR
jgi:hypothetical protein